MPGAKDLDPYTSPRSFYGAELRRLREQAGLSQEQLGERVFCSGAYIGFFEAAARRPQAELSKLLDGVLGTGEHFQRLCRLAQESKHAPYFADAVELEQRAATISEYAPLLVPGLLQTEAYARAITRVTLPLSDEGIVEEYVRARLDRQRILDGSTGPLFWTVLHEAVLRVPMGGSGVMAGQLRYLADAARRRRTIVQVLPFEAAADAFINGMVSIMTFPDSAPVVYLEGAGVGQLAEERALVEQSQTSYDLVRAAALSPVASLTLLELAAEDCTSS